MFPLGRSIESNKKAHYGLKSKNCPIICDARGLILSKLHKEELNITCLNYAVGGGQWTFTKPTKKSTKIKLKYER